MELSWKTILVTMNVHAVLYFSKFGNAFSQQFIFPKSVMELAQENVCNCRRACKPGDMEPELMCFSACACQGAPRDKINKAPAKCNSYDCNCPSSPEKKCGNTAKQVCTFDDGVFCEHENKYCVHYNDIVPQCTCKTGWTGPTCGICTDCHGASDSASSTTAMVLGALLVIVVSALILLIIVYWKLGRLPCQKNKPKKPVAGTKGTKGKPYADNNAYCVSGPMAGQQDMLPGKRLALSNPDGDTGEIEGEYAYAAINEYATVNKPAVPTAPVPSRSAAKAAHSNPYYFKLGYNNITEQSSAETPAPNPADCYTKVIRKPKQDAGAEKAKPPASQYDRLDRINFRPPPSSLENTYPSDNEYGTLSSSLASERSSPPV